MSEKEKVKTAEHAWYVVNAENKILGRLASRIANILRGKEKPEFVPYLDRGDYVIVINAEKVKVTGNKANAMTYFRHSTYPGGLRSRTFKEQLQRDPRKIIESAVWGMIPKTSLGKQIGRKLFVYKGPNHKHQAQKPVVLEV